MNRTAFVSLLAHRSRAPVATARICQTTSSAVSYSRKCFSAIPPTQFRAFCSISHVPHWLSSWESSNAVTRVSTDRIQQWKGDLMTLCIPSNCFSEDGKVTLPQEYSDLDKTLHGAIITLIKTARFNGAQGKSAFSLLAGANMPYQGLCLIGLGKKEEIDVHTWQSAGQAVAAVAKANQLASLGVATVGFEGDHTMAARQLLDGMAWGSFTDNRFKGTKAKPQPDPNWAPNVDLMGFNVTNADEELRRVRMVSSGVTLARQLVGSPANHTRPSTLAAVAQDIANQHSANMTVKILDRDECAKLEMGAYLAVAQGSDPAHGPKFIHLTYKPTSGVVRRKFALVGKGLTFDSGGYNLKVAGSSIELMKFDMGGAAAVLGAAKAIAQLQPDAEVHFIIAACENMINDKAIHPGDIVRASNGKTIEINNTDAEGRLTLADALVYAEKLNVDRIVDLATLTGACVVALGDKIAGLWSSSDMLSSELEMASKTAGERVWRMPLAQDIYTEKNSSMLADLKNSAGREGGSITAALFLKEFVTTTPWAHLDIAGPVWDDKKGGTGFGVRTLVSLVVNSTKQ